MRATTRRAVGVLTALLLTASGLVAGAVPANAGWATLTGASGDVLVTADVVATDETQGLYVRMDHNGTAIELTTAMVSVKGPSGDLVYSRETSFQPSSTGWSATDFDLPENLELGRYLLSFDATVVVQTETGPVDVRLAGTDVVEFYERIRPRLDDFRATPQNIPAGEKAVVSGIAWRGWAIGSKPLAGEQVQIWFDPKGTAPRVYRGTATVDSRGVFQTTLTAPSDGTWLATVPASDRFENSGWWDTVQETRVTDRTAHSGSAVAWTKGYAGGVRLVATDVVVGVDPVIVRFDAGVVGFGWARSSSRMWIDSRRGEGKYPNGVTRDPLLDWPSAVQPDNESEAEAQSDHALVRISPLMPAGIYDVGMIDQMIAICTAPPSGDRGGCIDGVSVTDRTITTMTVKRASSTSVSASSTSFTGPKTITLRGAVRKVKLISDIKVANRLSPNTPVKLYFDPAGSRGPVYKKTVRTGSDGYYTTRVGTSISGRWIAKYPGTDLQAPSHSAVTITVR
ncbi:hypothetical protein C8K30_103265 [Promicromonospora sp. AC04]|uniref:hypothetical protein n=1 Tax=Promicromonospora sp. AC04 TaxID=2135723 RepID=UPI000D4AD501|nr:hypothetical protein [Promicromonospora sp. AC04]PUB28841.1 hypothetical protein C8K30_103265 [Promicromonospora sp. AC04]